jgi:endonuclease YncB( thermonuclease family)
MLQMGHAWVYGGRLQNCGASKRVLCAAEKQARRARRGLWAAARPMPPYVWRNRHKRKFSAKQMKSACLR